MPKAKWIPLLAVFCLFVFDLTGAVVASPDVTPPVVDNADVDQPLSQTQKRSLVTSSTFTDAASFIPDQHAGLSLARQGRPVILYRDPNPPALLRVPPPRVFSTSRAQAATIHITYLPAGETVYTYNCLAWPNEAKTAFSYAASIWESLLTSSVTIEVDACWTDLGDSVLGSSSSNLVYNSSTSTYYQESLANALSGTNTDPADADMTIVYNSRFAWYYGTDGGVADGQMDFASVVLHEIGHGLGFGGSMTIDQYNNGYWGWGQVSDPAIYDRFTETGSGTPLLSLGNGTSTLGSVLTGGDIFFDGTHATQANGGLPPELYAPSPWKQGSSYSHLDYDTFNDSKNELMVWAIADGESIHSPGPVTLGLLEDVGWTIAETTPAPVVTSITPSQGPNEGTVHITDLSGSDFVSPTVTLTKSGEKDILGTNVTVVNASTLTCDFDLTGAAIGTWNVVVTNEDDQMDTLAGGFTVTAAPTSNVGIQKGVIGSDLKPGDALTFTLDITNTGTLTATNVVVTDVLPSEVVNPSFVSTLDITPTGAISYVWHLEPLAPGDNGRITIYGQVDPGLSGDFSFVNEATISDPDDITQDNNTSWVRIGNFEIEVYLPLVSKLFPPIPDTPILAEIINPEGDGSYHVDWSMTSWDHDYVLQEDDTANFISPATVFGPGFALGFYVSGQAPGTYYYRVRAINSLGGRSPWSNMRSVVVRPKPRAGFWTGASMEFYVTPDQTVDEFAIYISVSNCGNYRIYDPEPVSITNSQFSDGGSFYYSGTFNTETTASGEAGLNQFYIPDCGYVSGGPFDWTATWQDSSQPAVVIDEAAVVSVTELPVAFAESHRLFSIE
jgi:uncharacterized repeat protein (TIGR01451 family)